MVNSTPALQEGKAHHAAGRFTEAEAIYQKVIEIDAENAEVLHLIGVVAHQTGRNERAVDYLNKAIAIDPSRSVFYCNLGATYRALRQFDESIDCYQKSLALQPDNADAQYNLGVTLFDIGKLHSAEIHFKNAIALNPDFLLAHYNLGMTLRNVGKLEEAIACFKEVLIREPENDVANFLLAALTGNNYDQAPNQYIANLFDGCADYFDTLLVDSLEYDVPAQLVKLLRQFSNVNNEKWHVLDLGCGTGLVGIAIAPYAKQLIGVDLANGMLEKARARNLYSRLEQSDLLSMMQREATESYDIVVAADVFVYVGNLDEIFKEIKRILCPGGFMAFSVEAMNENSTDKDNQSYRLNPTGRYIHSQHYLEWLALANGLQIKQMSAGSIRLQDHKPVPGWLALLQRPFATST